MSRSAACEGKRATSTSCAATAAAATGEPGGSGIDTAYGSKRFGNAWIASWTAAWTIAISSIPDGPGRGGTAEQTVCKAIAFQYVTTSASAGLGNSANQASTSGISRGRIVVFLD